MISIERMQEAIRGEALDGWLFCNFAHRDALTDSLLGLDPSSVSSRRWFYLVPASGSPVKIVHAIEKGILDPLPGERETYSGRAGLDSLLGRFSGHTVAILSDPYVQVLSTMDASSASLASSCGMKTVSAAPLVQRIRGVLSPQDIASHEKAASILYNIVHDSWHIIVDAFRSGNGVFEGDIQDFMTQSIQNCGLVTDHPPIVGAGCNSGDPHYTVPGTIGSGTHRGKKIKNGDVVQFDIWAKFPGSVYADISWIGYCGIAVPARISRYADIVFHARDLVVPEIRKTFADRKDVAGSELDRIVRSYLLANVPEEAVQHRTGHGIDAECHGSGVNLDSVEFPDHRKLLEGSCFSVEPGVYFPDCGFRTEIDVYIQNGTPVISGGPIQHEILTLQDRNEK